MQHPTPIGIHVGSSGPFPSKATWEITAGQRKKCELQNQKPRLHHLCWDWRMWWFYTKDSPGPKLAASSPSFLYLCCTFGTSTLLPVFSYIHLSSEEGKNTSLRPKVEWFSFNCIILLRTSQELTLRYLFFPVSNKLSNWLKNKIKGGSCIQKWPWASHALVIGTFPCLEGPFLSLSNLMLWNTSSFSQWSPDCWHHVH